MNSVTQTSSISLNQPQTESKSCRNILVALGIISIVGSLIASGLLYRQIGTVSLAIGGGGVAVGGIFLLLSHYQSSSLSQVKNNKESEVPPVEIKIPRRIENTRVSAEVKELPNTGNTSVSTQRVPLLSRPALPALPLMGNVKIEENHPLTRPLSLSSLGEKINPELLNMPLSCWIDPESWEKTCQFAELAKKQVEVCKTFKNESVALSKSIDERIETFDQLFQIKERLKRLGYPPEISIGLVFFQWNYPKFKCLLMDEELIQLKFSDLQPLNTFSLKPVYQKLVDRLSAYFWKHPVQMVFKWPEVTAESIPELTFSSLTCLTPDQIVQFGDQLPPFTLFLIPRGRLGAISTREIALPLLETLFGSKQHLEKLSSTQINACIERITNKALFANLSAQHVIEFDFSKMDEEIFRAIYSVENRPESKADQLIPLLKDEQIYQFAKYFTLDHWKCLSSDQIRQLDYSKLQLTEEIVTAIFNDETKQLLLKNLSDPQKNTLTKHLSVTLVSSIDKEN